MPDQPVAKRVAAPESRRDVLFVVGFHRSGTSAVTGALHHYGFDLGKSLLPAVEYNTRGLFESKKVVDANETFLAEIGGRWDSLPLRAWADQAVVDRARIALGRRSRAILGQDFPDGSKPILLKEPRFCLTIPSWIEAAENLSYAPRILFVLRDPREVVSSLKERTRAEITENLGLWLTHTAEALSFRNLAPWDIVVYDAVLRNPVAILDGVMRRLGLRGGRDADSIFADVTSFIDPAMRHQRATIRDLEFPELQEAADLFVEFAKEPSTSVPGLEKDLNRLARAFLQSDNWRRVRESALYQARGKADQLYDHVASLRLNEEASNRKLAEARETLTAIMSSTSWRIMRTVGALAPAGTLRGDLATSLLRRFSSPPPAKKRVKTADQVPRIFVADDLFGTYDESSGAVRMKRVFELLRAQGYSLYYHPAGRRDGPNYKQALLELSITELRALQDVRRELSANWFDVAWIGRPHVGERLIPTVRDAAPEAHILYDTVDLHYLRILRQAHLEASADLEQEAMRVKFLEMVNSMAADRVVVVTDAEREALLAESPALDIAVVPNIHDIEDAQRGFPAGRRDIVFTGHYSHSPNVDAANALVDEILPRISKQRPFIRLHLIGSQMPRALRRRVNDQVVVHGWVRDLPTMYRNFRVFAAYLRYGAGMKGKLGQAMACGLPVVTTTVGAEGMGLTHRQNAMIADSPEEFTEAILQVYEDDALWKLLSDGGKQHVTRHYSREVVTMAVKAAIDFGGASSQVSSNRAGARDMKD